MNGIDKTKEEILENVLGLSGLHPSKIRNIYIYGSRVYGTHTVNSDYDLIVLACSLYVNHEIHEGEYNIHITTPDSFEDQLRQHDIHCLECVFAPDNARIQTTIDYSNFKINIGQLKKMIMSQSSWAWSKAQRRMEKGNIMGGTKSLFHSLRILKFGMQIMEFGKIVDFSAANDMWEGLRSFDGLEWDEYQNEWFPVKKGLMKEFRRAHVGQNGLSNTRFRFSSHVNLNAVADAFEKAEQENI